MYNAVLLLRKLFCAVHSITKVSSLSCVNKNGKTTNNDIKHVKFKCMIKHILVIHIAL